MADVFPLILGIIILLASVISIKTGISVTVVEIAIGVINRKSRILPQRILDDLYS